MAECKTQYNSETDIDLSLREKRKRSEGSSLSEIESPINKNTKTKQSNTDTSKTKKKKAKQTKQQGDEEFENTNINMSMNMDFAQIQKQLVKINEQLSQVMTKDDGSLRETIKSVFVELKEDLLQSVSKRIDILESKLFDKDLENDKLKEDLKNIERDLENQKTENENLRRELDLKQSNYEQKLNNLEQYGRRNNLRINGIAQADEKESAEATTKLLCETLNEKFKTLKLNISRGDIDVAHRLGKLKNGKRQIIVKFNSRMTKDFILRNRKLLKGSGIFITEDLTSLNNHVLQCVRFKTPDEVKNAWSSDGKILYEDKMDTIHEVKYKDFQHWIELSWPEKTEKTEGETDG